ncbi:MAG: Dockerin type domain [Planctomycetota bacterium]
MRTPILAACLATAIAAGAANAVDSPNGVVDPGFEGSSTAWQREFYRAPGGTNQCGVASVQAIADGRAGHARLSPIYVSTASGLNQCSTSFPCPPDPKSGETSPGFVQGMVSLFQRDIPIANGDYLEFSFDYRIKSALDSVGCILGCASDYAVLDARVIGASSGVESVLEIYHDGSADSGWRRARIGYQRGSVANDTVEVRFTLLASVLAEAGYAYGAYVDIDNVSVVTFAGSGCDGAWNCPLAPANPECPKATAPNYFTNTALVSVAAAPSDAPAAFDCERPCAAACQGDVNGDGSVNGGDLGAVLGAWGSSWPAADIDGDGLVNGGDLGAVLANWGCTS